MDAATLGASDAIRQRKLDHVTLAIAEASQTSAPAGWDDIHLVPRALPGVSLHDVDLSTELFGRPLALPIVLAGMTGGHDDAVQLNAVLGAVAQRFGLAVGVGSQRAALADPSLERSFASVRDRAPTAVVLANIGACQLVAQSGCAALTGIEIARLVDMVRADAVAIHLNVVQEVVQREGDREFGRLIEAIAALVQSAPVPVVVKETGAGMSSSDAQALAAAGVSAIDVGGAGGTSFALIEASRSARLGDERGQRLGSTFGEWGIPTASSLLEVRSSGAPIIATGGVRSGLDAAKALALGATAVGLGRPAMLAAQRGEAALCHEIELFAEELRAALALTGARRAADLHFPVLSGYTLEWARQRQLL